MATINFYLKEPTAMDATPVTMFFSFDGKRVKIATGELVLPKDWDMDKQRVKRSGSGSIQVNQFLESLSGDVQKIYREARIMGETPTPEYIKNSIKEQLAPSPKLGFFDYYEQFVESSKVIRRPWTIKNYKSTLKRLKEFESKKRKRLSFETLDIKFYDAFLSFLINDLKQVNNTVGKHIKTLKTFLRWCEECGIEVKQDFKKFKTFQDEVETISLSEEELNRLGKLDLSDNKRLENVRDLFLLGCYTGLRFSDLSQLTAENVKPDFIRLHTQKTKDSLTVPLNRFAKEIIAKYPDLDFNFISNQKMNAYLKELGKLAEINEPVQSVRYSGSGRIEKSVPKHDLITTHTARRSFVTLSLLKGMPAEIVMKITGHKDWKSFKKYVKVTERIAYDEMQRVW